MSKLSFLVFLALFTLAAQAEQQYVQGHFRRDGSWEMPHHQSAPDNNRDNNWDVQGNLNPYTGEWGTKPRTQYLNQELPRLPSPWD